MSRSSRCLLATFTGLVIATINIGFAARALGVPVGRAAEFGACAGLALAGMTLVAIAITAAAVGGDR